MVNIQEIEQALDVLDKIEELSEEEKAELVANMLYYYMKQMQPNEFKQFFKTWLLQNPEVMETQLETLKRKLEKQLRLALKQRRKEFKIKRL